MDEMEFESGTANHLRGTSVSASVPVSDGAENDQAGNATSDAAQPAAGSPPTPASDAPSQNVLLDWSAPAEVGVGEQFTAVLKISALKAIDQLPLMLGFDPKVLQVVSIEEGGFMAQGGGHSSLTKEVNLSAGKITATAIRQGTAVSGQGSLLQVTFKALTATDKTPIRVLSATPSPEQAGVAKLSDVAIKIR